MGTGDNDGDGTQAQDDVSPAPRRPGSVEAGYIRAVRNLNANTNFD